MAHQKTYERVLGDTELSYYLPSRTDGVNDMYLHVGFRAPAALVTDHRIRTIWATLSVRHPMLATQVLMDDGQYDAVWYRYSLPSSSPSAMVEASLNLCILIATKDEVVLRYLNGPRLLSDKHPAQLIFARDPSSSMQGTAVSGGVVSESLSATGVPANGQVMDSMCSSAEKETSDLVDRSFSTTPAVTSGEDVHEFHFCLCAAHFLGDGMALHKTANQFFLLLGCPKTDDELLQDFHAEWANRWEYITEKGNPMPLTIESKLPSIPDTRFANAAARIDFENLQRKTIGGHLLPRQKLGPRHTVVPTHSFTPTETKRALANCKANGVTISHAMFGLCNLVWAKMKAVGNEELPTMMYGAINLRSYVPPLEESHFYLAVTYFNVMLPSFIPRTLSDSQVLWLRAKSTKLQMNTAVKSPLFVHRTHEMAGERRRNAIGWAKADDEKAKGTWTMPLPQPVPVTPQLQKTPSQALLGLSMLGNLDGIYQHKNFPSIALHTLTTGSRQRGGAILLFAYTFAGRLWLSLGYDYNGFDREALQALWDGLVQQTRRCIIGETC